MIVVGDVITRARDQHPSFDRASTPDAVLFRHLEDYAGELAGRVLKVRPGAITADHTITFPLASFPAGAQLPAYQMLHGGTVYLRGDYSEEFEFIARESRMDAVPRWSGAVTGGVLYLTGGEPWWRDAERLVIRYAPSAEPLENLESVIALPIEARPALVAAAAGFMASRSRDTTVDRGYFAARFDAAEARFLDWLIQRERVTVSIAPDGW